MSYNKNKNDKRIVKMKSPRTYFLSTGEHLYPRREILSTNCLSGKSTVSQIERVGIVDSNAFRSERELRLRGNGTLHLF